MPAAGQGFFYREETKDGRLYVFASAAQYQRWEKSGALATSIMRVDYGPAHETVVFDGEAAVNLYNFKHGLPGEVFPAPRASASQFSWGDGKMTFETDRFLLNFSNRMQLRWIEDFPDAQNQFPGATAKGQDVGSFRFQRVRTKLDGWVYQNRIEYELQLDWADANSIVQDADLNLDVLGGRKLMLKIGQFKIPFGRQAITSAMYQQFVDRSIVSVEDTKLRDQGLQVWGMLGGTKLEYRAGMFNGNGRQRTLGTPAAGSDNPSYSFDARVMYQPWGDVKYSEGDFESTDKPLLAVAADVETDDARVPPATGGTTPSPPTFKREVWAGDVSFKFRGFSAFAEYFARRLTPVAGPDFHSDGYHVQTGYFLKRNVVEVAFRWATWDPTDVLANDDRTELGVAASYFYSRHNLKATSDFRRLEDKARKTTDHELRIQVQLVF